MAKLEHTVDAAKFNALDTNAKGFYVQQGDKYVLDVDTTPALTALEAERQARKALETKLAGYGDMTPEQVKALNDAKAKAEREKDFANGNFEKILAEEREKHQKNLDLRDQGEKRLRDSLQQALIDSEAVRAITALKGNPELLMPLVTSRTKLQTVGDREVAVVIGDKGGPRLKAGAKSAEDFMPISEYVAELKADKRYAGAFESGVGSGSRTNVPTNPTRAAEVADRQAKMDRVVNQLKEAQAEGRVARVSE